ncbi:SDR family oxidoreductase [Mollicutes bacterium LVI A0039]|nr:SDR family oxidoreductase [Mollicutes bacterium LVI A0039]
MENKLIVITGASSGFGYEMAKLFNAKGYSLLLLARREERLKEICAELNSDNVMYAKVDVADYQSFAEVVKQAEDKFGPVDLLVNNAGTMLLGDVLTQDRAEWQTMIDVNVTGVLNGMKIVASQMKERNHGTIINVSSIAGVKAFGNHAAYSATKFGVHGMTETVRQELAMSNVRVGVISPGAAETELLGHTTSQEIKDGYAEWKQTMGGSSMDPIAVANSVVYMYELPQNVNIRELQIAPTMQVD